MNGDEEPIHSYSRARAISDGVLVDVTVLAGQAGIKHPTAVTQAVIEKCVRVPDGMSDQDEAGRLWDLLWTLHVATRQAAGITNSLRLRVAVKQFADAGLRVPVKSECFYCPASKKHEIVSLRDQHPELMKRALAIEENSQPNLTSVVGLGRSFSWADFLADLDDTPLFPSCE